MGALGVGLLTAGFLVQHVPQHVPHPPVWAVWLAGLLSGAGIALMGVSVTS
jgi:hypothetical protein